MAHGMDDGTSDDVAGRWMTYAELARLRGVDKPSALKLALRKRWPRRKDNHGIMQVCVPPDWARPWSDGTAHDMPQTTPHDTEVSRAISALEDANAGLVARARAADARAERAEAETDRTIAELNVERGRADRAEHRTDVLQDKIDSLQAQVATAEAEAETARAAAREAAQAAEALRKAEAELRARGLWARLRGAWRARGRADAADRAKASL